MTTSFEAGLRVRGMGMAQPNGIAVHDHIIVGKDRQAG
jgi:hypothetical protein